MKKILITATFFLTAFSSLEAGRIAFTGPYVGANFGYSQGSLDKDKIREAACQYEANLITGLLGNCQVTSLDIDDRTIGAKLFGGYLFGDHFALEGGYFNLGEVSFDAQTNTGTNYAATASMQGINVDAIGHFPLRDDFTIFARAGATYTEVNKEYTLNNYTLNKWGVGYKLGVGMEYDLTSRLGFRIEFETYHMQEKDAYNGGDMFLYSLGVVYSFGDEPETIIIEKEVPVTVEVEKVVEKVVEKQVIKTERVVLASDALFEYNKADVKTAGELVLRKLAPTITENDYIIVSGHTDNIGSDEFNIRLSQRRADAVKQQLVNFGIDPEKIETRAMGESHPIATNETEKGRAFNRRVEIQVQTYTE